MKKRFGFVSNSSSSSFICNLCEETFSGWDLSVTEVEHCRCENDHVFCEEELIGVLTEEEDEGGGYVLAKKCPFCTFKFIADEDMKSFLVHKYNISEAEVFAVIKEQNKRRRKLYPNEYISYVMTKFDSSADIECTAIREKYSDYDEFYKELK